MSNSQSKDPKRLIKVHVSYFEILKSASRFLVEWVLEESVFLTLEVLSKVIIFLIYVIFGLFICIDTNLIS